MFEISTAGMAYLAFNLLTVIVCALNIEFKDLIGISKDEYSKWNRACIIITILMFFTTTIIFALSPICSVNSTINKILQWSSILIQVVITGIISRWLASRKKINTHLEVNMLITFTLITAIIIIETMYM